MRNAVVVIGSQWGDEGKGKITNYLSQKADVVVRYQGGDNAGHTIQFLGNTYALHVIPSGVFNSKTKNVLGNGVVFNPKTFLEEVKNLKDKGFSCNNLYISDRAHVIFDYHKELDGLSEEFLGANKIGTTKKGIGPCYTDKMARQGIRVGDLISNDFEKMYKENLKIKTRVQAVTEQKNVIAIQKYKDGVILHRHFRFYREDKVDLFAPTNTKKAHHRIYGEERIRLFEDVEKHRTDIYYGQERMRLENQDWWNTKNGTVFDKETVVYPYGYKETDLPIETKRCIDAAIQGNVTLDYNTMIRIATERKYLEYLLRGRYFNIAKKLIEWGMWREAPDWLNTQANTPHELLRLDKQRANRLRDMDGNVKTLLALQFEKRTGQKISQENLTFINKYEVDMEDLQIQRTGLTVNKAVNFFRRQMGLGNSYQHTHQTYSDYLDMAAEKGMNLHDDIVRVNARMLEFHQHYVDEKNREENKKRAEELNKKFKNIKKNYEKNRKMYDFETEEYIFRVASCAEDIIQEGQRLHHCVAASDTYFKRMDEGISFIVFMRKKKEPAKSYYTVEIKDTKILQAYAAYDRQPNYQSVKKELNKWKQEIEKRMRGEKEYGRIAS